MLSDRLTMMSDVPTEIRRAFREREEPTSAEQMLFQEICARAVADALGHASPSEPGPRRHIINDAREWIENGENVEEFFLIAGILLERVRPAVSKSDPTKLRPKRRRR